MKFNQLLREMNEPVLDGAATETPVQPDAYSEASILDGMSKPRVVRYLNKMASEFTKGFFTDESWVPVHAIFRKMRELNIDGNIVKTQYGHNEKGTPNSKTWWVEVLFKDDRGKDQKALGVITASGAGSVADPLDRYDLTAYFN